MPTDYMPMRTRPVEDGWIHVEMDRSTGEQLISSLTIEQGIVPDVEGMGLKDAVYLLENARLSSMARAESRHRVPPPEARWKRGK